MRIRNPFNWALRFGTIPSEFREAMTYEEQIMWLYYQIKQLKEGTANYNYDLLENKPSINGIDLVHGLTASNLGLQERLIAGENISIVGNTISATGGGGSGGTTNYNLLDNKPSINGVELVGDKSFNDLGLQTEKSYLPFEGTIVSDKYFNTEVKFIGDVVPIPTTEANSMFMYINVNDLQARKFRISGTAGLSSAFFTCNENPSVVSASNVFKSFSPNNTYVNDEVSITIPDDANFLVFNFVNTNVNVPSVEYIVETVGGTSNYNLLNNKPSINGVELVGNKSFEDLGLNIMKEYDELTSYVTGSYFNLTFPSSIGDIVTAPTTAENTAYLIIDKNDIESNTFRVTGASSNYIYFLTDNEPLGLDVPTIQALSSYDTGFTDEEITIDFGDASFLVFNFTDTDVTIPKVEVVTETFGGDVFYNKLSEDLVLTTNTTPSLEEGYYYTNGHSIKIGNSVQTEFNDCIFYYDSTGSSIDSPKIQLVFNKLGNAQYSYIFMSSNQEWQKVYGINLTDLDVRTSVSSLSTNSTIPSSKAVYDFVTSQGGDSFYTEIDENITCASDGTITPVLTDGYYFLTSPHHIQYIDSDNTAQNTYVFTNSIFYLDSTNKVFKRTSINESFVDQIQCRLTYNQTYSYWSFSNKGNSDFVQNSNASINEPSYTSNNIPATGRDYYVPTIEALREYTNKLSIIEAGIASSKYINITGAWSANAQKVDLDTETLKYGNDFTLSNGYIVVGSNPKIVEVVAQMSPFGLKTSGTDNDKTYMLIIKRDRGGTITNLTSQSQIVSSAPMLAFNVSLITDVQEGDKLYLAVGGGFSSSQSISSGAGTNMITIKTLSTRSQS